MWTTRPRARALFAAAALAAATLSACSGESADDGPTPTSARAVAQALSDSLDARARAVRRGNLDAFLREIGGGAAFREHQRTWFANLTQLPLERFGYGVQARSLVRDGDAYWVTVRQTLQLEGYDDTPVVTLDRYRFAPARRDPGRYRLVSVTDPDWEAEHGIAPQPWDLGPVWVRAGPGVLGVFDAGSVEVAPELLDSVERGIASVAGQVPYPWSRTAVVYALSDPAFLDGLADLPGEHPGELDAVAFPVGDGVRVALNPRMLARGGAERDRLLRHELTHVALADRDDDAPVWLAEGLAEWVSVAPLAPQDRRIPEAAVAAAEAGVADLPADETFNDADSEAHYGIAWWAVEHLADSYGPDAPWQLLDALAEGPDADAVLAERFATTTAELAEHAARLIRAHYSAG